MDERSEQELLELLEVEAAELAISSLSAFVRLAWPIVEPGANLVWNWHLDIICDALERQARGEPGYRKLLICVPPGSMKSLLVSVFAPAWEWLHAPERRKIFLANDDALAVRDSRRTRQVITSEWYRSLVEIAERARGRQVWDLAADQNQKVNFENTRRGFRQCLSVGAAVTGKRADDIVIDDPIDAKAVVNGSIEQIAKRLKEVANVVEKVLPSRVNNLARARWTIIMQRLHQADTAARAMAEGDWRVVNIQMEFDPDNPLNHFDDPRRDRGELMFPGLFPGDETEKLKTKLGSSYSAQYQQDPRPAEGGILKRHYWCFWYPDGVDAPQPVLVVLPDGRVVECRQAALPSLLFSHAQSWDMAFKDTRDSAFVVGQVWARQGSNSYLLDQVRAKMDFVASVEAMRTLTARWPQAIEKLIEDKANGPAIISQLRNEVAGILPVEPQGGKEARANAAAPLARAGNLWLPHPTFYPWVNDLIAEAEAFPFGEYADQVDTLSQYVIYRYGTGASTTEALAQW